MRIMVIESGAQRGKSLKNALEENGHTVEMARYDVEGRAVATGGRHALILLDMPPLAVEGVSMLRAIRKRSNVPVLVLTERDRVQDRVLGLQFGADDYLVKPFADAELLACVQALLQRGGQMPVAEVLQLADLELDEASRTCTRSRARIDLTGQEFALLAVLLRARGQVLSRAHLAEQVWDGKLDSDTTNAIEVAIRRLRSKVDEPFARKLLHTVRGQGYVLEDRS